MSWWTTHKILKVIMYISLTFLIINCFLFEIKPTLYPEWLRDCIDIAVLFIIVFWLFGCIVYLIYKAKNRKEVSGKFSFDEMKEHLTSVLPDNAALVEFSFVSKSHSNMIVKIKQSGILHTFTTDRGKIYHNNIMLCDSSYQYKEKQDTFPKLIQMIKNTLV